MISRAVVLGGGFAGVLAARVLTAYAREVVLVEAGRYPAGPVVRTGLPQAHHSHVLVTGGARALDMLIPGTVDALLAAGAHRRGLTSDALIRSAAGWLRRHETDAYVVSASRWLTDHVVRGRALSDQDIVVRTGVRALGFTGDAARITGVVLAGLSGIETVPADLVVDATGRRSRTPRWLADLGAAPVEEETVDSGLCYATRLYQAPPELGAAIPAIMLHPQERHGLTVFPIEGGRWIVTLTGARDGIPPVDPEAFTAAAARLAPIVADLMAAAVPLGGVRPYRMTANRRRRFELARHPAGLVVLGDAVAATNPVYSHGMSVAALSVLRLDTELARHGPDPSACAGFQAAVADEVDLPWRMATGADRGGAGGSALPPPLRLRLDRNLAGSPDLLAEMFRAQTLIGTPADSGATLRRALATTAPPLLSPDEAVAQYPRLSTWWLGRPA